jgi:methionine-rich copper-binding protein CopC
MSILTKIIKTIVIVTILAPLQVMAHAILVKSSPTKDETLSQAPKEINLWFNDAVRGEYKALAVIDSKGNRVDNHDVEQSLTDGSNIHASLQNLIPGTYIVRYRVVSEDTHIVTGKFEFKVK